jgi:uncharacterized protein HemX
LQQTNKYIDLLGVLQMPFLLSLLSIKKLWIYLAVLLFVVGAYYAWKASVERQALLQFNQQQLEQTVRDQEEFRQRQAAIEEQQRQAARQLIEENRRLRASMESIQTMLNSPEFSANDRPSSDILKRTIEQLRNRR